MSEKLVARCPFCKDGGRPGIIDEPAKLFAQVHCTACRACGPRGCGLTRKTREGDAIAAWNAHAEIRELESASQPGGGEAVNVDAVRANFTPFYIMSNVRRIVPAYYNKQRANWVLAMDVFAVGSRSAHRICEEAGIDPDGFTVERAAPSAGNGGAEGGGK